jgi:hypothetical protein
MSTAPVRSEEKLPPEVLLLQNGHPHLAIPMLEEKLGKDPQNWEHHVNIGIAYRLTGNFILALLHQNLAVQNKPTSAQAWHNLAITKTEIGDFDGAFVAQRRAYELEPHQSQVLLGMACALMREGKIHLAWPLWEEARYKQTFSEFPKVPLWTGTEDLKDKRLLVMREGGFGDSIMFLRWFPELLDRGAVVYFQCWEEQVGLFQGHPWISHVFSEKLAIAPRDFDYCVSLLSLPAVLNCQPDKIPCAEHYIEAIPDRKEMFHVEHFNGKPLVGICWGAEEQGFQKATRSISDAEIEPFQDCSAAWFSLWPGHRTEWMSAVSLKDWGDTAALISNLDLVVSADTAVAHLAGAMGKPTFLIVPVGSDWRWFRGMDTSPWYPSMKIFRSTEPGSFKTAIEKVAHEINAGC